MWNSFLNALRELNSKLFPDKPLGELKFMLDACLLKDRVLYSATILPTDLDSGLQDSGFAISDQEIEALMALVESALSSDVLTTDASSVLGSDVCASEEISSVQHWRDHLGHTTKSHHCDIRNHSLGMGWD